MLATDSYDFIDFGCSKGGSLAFGRDKLGGKNGLGIDRSEAKVEEAIKSGFQAVVGDARTFASGSPKSVRFVTMIDFLEHLPGFQDAVACVRSACELSREFIFIRQPWFDSDSYLFSIGLKLYWSDWTGHPNAMTTLEFYRILTREPSVARFRLYGRGLIADSGDAAVHPLTSPVDQHDWKASQHVPKPVIRFEHPVYRQIMCIAILEGGSQEIEEIEQKLPFDQILYEFDRHP
jgi:hypothetical protein